MNITDSFCLRNRKWILLLLVLMSYPLFFHKLGDRDLDLIRLNVDAGKRLANNSRIHTGQAASGDVASKRVWTARLSI